MPFGDGLDLEAGQLDVGVEVVLADVRARQRVRLQVGAAPQSGEPLVRPRAEHSVLRRPPEVARHELWVVHQIAGILHASRRYTIRLECFGAGLRRAGRAPFTEALVDLPGPGDPTVDGLQRVVIRQIAHARGNRACRAGASRRRRGR